jgi:DivIVA domain-containing protein
MTVTSGTVDQPQERAGRLSPADVHNVLFSRARLGRRGYDETEVDDFLDRVQFELSRLVGEKSELRDEVTRLRSRLQESNGSSSAQPGREEASIQAVRILSAAQQTADQYVAEAEHYSRRMSSDARMQYEDLIAEARARAQELLEDAHRAAQDSADQVRHANGSVAAVEGRTKQELEEQIAYLRTFSQVCRVQLRAYLEALLQDIEEEWGRADPGVVMQRSLPTGARVIDVRDGGERVDGPDGRIPGENGADGENGAGNDRQAGVDSGDEGTTVQQPGRHRESAIGS